MRWDLERAVRGAMKISSLLSVVKNSSVEKMERGGNGLHVTSKFVGFFLKKKNMTRKDTRWGRGTHEWIKCGRIRGYL